MNAAPLEPDGPAHVVAEPQPGFDRLHVLALLLVVLAAAAWRVHASLHANTPYDGFGYILIARSILEGQLATPYIASTIVLHFEPLYPALIAGLRPLTGDLFASARVVNVIAGTLLLAPVYGFGRDLFGKRAALFAAALTVAHPMLVRVSATAFSEALYVLLAVTGSWWWWRAWSRGGWGWALGGALMMALATLTRTQGLSWVLSALLGLVALRLAFPDKASPRLGAKIGLSLLLYVALVLPYWALQDSLTARAGGSSKILQEIHKKTSLFGRPQWEREERTLNEAGDRLLWIERSEQAPLRWIAQNPRIIADRAARDLGYFVRVLAGPQFVPPVVLIPGLLLIAAVASKRAAPPPGTLAYLGLSVLGTVLALSLVAVTNDRYLAAAAPLLVIVAGAGADLACRGLASLRGLPWLGGRAASTAAPGVILVLAVVGYPEIPYYEQQQARGKRLDQVARDTAGWAARFLDPLQRERILAFEPAVPSLTGDVFYLLPLGSPERVASYARRQGADYVLLDVNYFRLQSPEDRAAWTRALDEGALSSLGLQPVAGGAIPVEAEPALRPVQLLRVSRLADR